MLLHGRHAPRTGDRGEPVAPGQGGDDRRLRRVLVAITLSLFLVDLDFFSLNLALPRMAEDLGTTTTNMQWAVSAYMLTVGL